MVNVFIEPALLPVSKREVEYVERKGLGHPDSICDAVMESISLNLCRAYRECCGRVLHHNIDKGLLSAGQTSPRLGGGSVDQPMRFVVGDRATTAYGDRKIPVGDIVQDSVAKWFSQNLRFVDPAVHLVVQNELRKGSAELVEIFDRDESILVANDTSAVVGFAPLSETERLVLETEHFLNSAGFKQEFPETGEDVKVMGLRRGRDLELTVAVAFVDRFFNDAHAYFDCKQRMQHKLNEHLFHKLDALDGVSAYVNMLDRPDCGDDGIYVTVLGTSAEAGDGGQVGRGNRVNGLISLCRPMTLEAAAGKNPVSHVGKVYNQLASHTARVIHESLDVVDEVYLWFCSQIGQRIDQPWSVSAQLALADGAGIGDVADAVNNIVHEELRRIGEFSEKLVQGELSVC